MGFVLFENSSYWSYQNKNNVHNVSFMDPGFSFPFLLKILKLLCLDLFSDGKLFYIDLMKLRRLIL